MISLETNELKACPACGQALKLHYRFCIRCGQECPIPPVCPEADPDDDEASPGTLPLAVIQVPTTPEPAPLAE